MRRVYIGLEIHIQLNTRTKIFCGCANNFGDPPNTNVCPICLGYPGVLPALNEAAIQKSFLTALTLGCNIHRSTFFARKNYFYPDLPKNYQISQFGAPIGVAGRFKLLNGSETKLINITEIHLEEDAGKMIHSGEWSLVDFNRTGTPLMEIVTAPDLTSGREAELMIQQLRQLVRYLGVSDGNMEEGSLRCDANISIGEPHALPPYKVEVKNINSSRFVRKALEYETERQLHVLEKGGTLTQETRLWNEHRDITKIMRSKEETDDYRYFPEPDLPPFYASEDYLQGIKKSVPELPLDREQRLTRDHHLSAETASHICASIETADFFEATVAHGADPLHTARWLFADVKKELNHRSLSLSDSPLTPARLAQILIPLHKGELHTKLATQLLTALFEEQRDPRDILKDERWRPLSADELRTIVTRVLAENPRAVQEIKEGTPKPMGYLIGEIMKRCGGRGDPQQSQRLLRHMIASV